MHESRNHWQSPIIVLEGGTGVGTSTFSFRLAKELNIPSVISTDCIRQVLRCAISPQVNPALGTSTYLAGRSPGYETKSEDEQYRDILHGYELQCYPIHTGVDGVIKRAIRENRPLIMEGVHLHPGRIQESDWYSISGGRIIEICIYIDDPDVHRERFLYRQQKAPEREMEMYLKNFREIRWIHDYLLTRARCHDNIVCVNNNRRSRDCQEELLDVLGAVGIG